jgi:hypothetical protein
VDEVKEEWLGFCYLKSENIEVGKGSLQTKFSKRTVDWLYKRPEEDDKNDVFSPHSHAAATSLITSFASDSVCNRSRYDGLRIRSSNA